MPSGWHVFLMSGPPGAGKTQLAQMLATAFLPQFAHYVRLYCPTAALCPSGTTTHERAAADVEALTGRARSAEGCDYRPERCFEVIPELLARVYLRNPRGIVLLEADADPCIGHAFTYDRKVFMMPAPARLTDVFRTTDEAADALRDVMQDTACFAKEIFGLFDRPARATDPQSDPFTRFAKPQPAPVEGIKPRPAMTESQIFRFLRTPLGSEVASRIQLQPMYHGLADSDLVVVNTAVGAVDGEAEQCVGRLNVLLSHLPRPGGTRSQLFCCDLADPQDPVSQKLFTRLVSLSSLER